VRTITGPTTGLYRPYAVALDVVNGELFVVSDGSHSISVFPIDADGDIAPLWFLNDSEGRGITSTEAAFDAWGFVLWSFVFVDGFESGDTSAWTSAVP